MKKIHKTVLIWYWPEEIFDLVIDAQRYPEFLPWCSHAHVRWHNEEGMEAELGIRFAGIEQSFTTRNSHVPGREVRMQLVQGPFSNLAGLWQFLPVGDGSQRACKVVFELEYEFSTATLSRIVGPVFDKIASTFVDAFVKRADGVYAHKPAPAALATASTLAAAPVSTAVPALGPSPATVTGLGAALPESPAAAVSGSQAPAASTSPDAAGASAKVPPSRPL